MTAILSNEALKATTRQLYRHFSAGNLAGALTLLADDFVLTNPMPAGVPFGGTYHGHEGLSRYFQEIFASLRVSLVADEYLVEGNCVVVFGVEDSIAKATGKSYHIKWAHHLRYSVDGLVRELHEYNPTAAIAAAFVPTA